MRISETTKPCGKNIVNRIGHMEASIAKVVQSLKVILRVAGLVVALVKHDQSLCAQCFCIDN